jgi:hypothetical protein
MALGKEGEPLPSACWSGTRQRKLNWALMPASVPRAASWHLAKGAAVGSFAGSFAECARRNSAKGAYLPSARTTTLDNESLRFSGVPSLSSVTLGKVTKTHLFIYLYYSIQTNKTYITYTSHSSQNHHYIIETTYLTKTSNLTSFSQI